MAETDALDRTTRSRGSIEKIAMLIPGFQGYLRAEHRREADRLQRAFLSRRLDETRERVREAVAVWTDENRFGNLEAGNGVQDVLQRVSAKIRDADQGYAGFFGSTRVDEEALEMLYEIDKHLLRYVEEVEGAAAGLDVDAEDGACKKALRAVRKATESLETAFAERKDMITGVA